jgi:hypothetical protein
MASSSASAPVHTPHHVVANAEFLETVPMFELHRSNVLRLETEELLQECWLDLQHVKWHTAAQQYISQVNTVLERLPTGVNVTDTSIPLPLEADKLPNTPLELGESPLHVMFDMSENALGMTTKQGNAKELPLLQWRSQLTLLQNDCTCERWPGFGEYVAPMATLSNDHEIDSY